ncbi:MAG: hypothetical protein WBD58_07745 [Geitlerinemataceae cyanobacterium]
MKKLSLLAFVGWSMVTGTAFAQEPLTEIRSRDLLCRDVKTGMSLQEVLDLATGVGIEIVPTLGEDNTVFLDWSSPQTSENFSASFFDNSLANFSCSMVVSNPQAQTAEPTTCDRVAMGMTVDSVKTLMAEAGFTALPRSVGADESLWEWSNSQTSEFLRMILSNNRVVSISCSTQANEIEPDASVEEEPNPDNSLEFGEELPDFEEQ